MLYSSPLGILLSTDLQKEQILHLWASLQTLLDGGFGKPFSLLKHCGSEPIVALASCGASDLASRHHEEVAFEFFPALVDDGVPDQGVEVVVTHDKDGVKTYRVHNVVDVTVHRKPGKPMAVSMIVVSN